MEVKISIHYGEQTTKDELTYLKGLGGWRDPGSRFAVSSKLTGIRQIVKVVYDFDRRRELLRLYRDFVIPARSNWCHIEVGKLLEYIEQELGGNGTRTSKDDDKGNDVHI